MGDVRHFYPLPARAEVELYAGLHLVAESRVIPPGGVGFMALVVCSELCLAQDVRAVPIQLFHDRIRHQKAIEVFDVGGEPDGAILEVHTGFLTRWF